jgi:hypothetical protein
LFAFQEQGAEGGGEAGAGTGWRLIVTIPKSAGQTGRITLLGEVMEIVCYLVTYSINFNNVKLKSTLQCRN